MESSRFCDQFVMSVPLRRMTPPSTRPLPASRPSVACAVVVLPEPDLAHQCHDLARLYAERDAVHDPLFAWSPVL